MGEAFRTACLIGWPVKHSKSPIIHGHWMECHGIAGEYRLEEVSPDDFTDFVTNLAAHGYVGSNVTIPHKEMALAASEPDERARAVGAANTLWLDNGRLRSTNTDVEGFVSCLDDQTPGWDANLENALLLGAGGAARAVAHGLLERGARNAYVVNRTFPRAVSFQARLGSQIHPAHWRDVPALLCEADLIVNATSLGMVGNPDMEIDLDAARDDAVVADLVYTPLMTSLLKAAEKRGLRYADGLGMLLHQAARPFELWWGVRPEVTPELRDLVVRALNAG
ncbi:MAG: shikimate dehydrogenase [Alphaproteobacteria bacterium]|nr:shikimate dehydrogenase [Alphaproteobacteria bacterium]